MHGARVVALRGNFDQALSSCASSCARHPIALVNSRQPVPPRGPEDRGVRGARGARRRPRRAVCIPVGNAGNITAYWRGFVRSPARRRAMFGFQAEGAAPLVHGAARRRSPRRSPARSGSATRRAGRRRWTRCATRAAAIRAVSDDEILDAYRLLAAREGVFCEPASAASVAGLLHYGADGARADRLRAHRPRAEGPADRARAGRRGRALRARRSTRSSAPCCAMNRAAPARPRPAPLGQPRARASTRSPRRWRCTWSSRSRRPARFAVETDLADRARPAQPRGPRLRAAAPARRLHVPDPLGHPAQRAAWARAPRRSSRG